MSNTVKNPETPKLKTLFDNHLKEIFYKLRNCMPAKIVSFNPDNQTAEVQIMMQDKIPDHQTNSTKLVNYPKLVDCPVFVLSGNAGGLRIPINPGDSCLVLFSDRDIDQWFSTGNAVYPNTERKHNLADGIVLVGIRSLVDVFDDYDNTSTQLNYNSARIKLNAKILIENDKNNLKTLLNNLIGAIEGIVTFGSPTTHVLTAGSVTALEAVKTQIAEVLA